VLAALTSSCGGTTPAPAPPAQTAQTARTATAAPAVAAVPEKVPEASPPPGAAFPPAPWAIAAVAPAGRRFQRHPLGESAVWVACYTYEMSGACLQPEMAVERSDGLEATNALANGMPTLQYIDLRKEPEGHWGRIRHKAARVSDPCGEDTYFGPRGMTGLYGHFPDDVWMTVDRSGEEYVMTSVTTVYRFQGNTWKAVGATKKLGDRIQRLFPWKQGMLAFVESQGAPSRFLALGARAGSVVPRIPKDTMFDRLVVGEGGVVLAAEARMDVTLFGWAPQSAMPARLALRAVLYDSDSAGDIDLTPTGDVELRGFGELPLEKKATGEFRMDKVRAKLRLDHGRWKVLEEKLEDWKGTPLEASRPPALDGVAGFSQQEELAAPDGSRWITGTLQVDGEEKVVLLHDRPAVRSWQVSGASLKEPANEPSPNCLRLGPSPPARPKHREWGGYSPPGEGQDVP